MTDVTSASPLTFPWIWRPAEISRLLSNVLRPKTRQPSAPPVHAQMTPGLRAYAIGDVHGRDDLLSRLLDRVQDDMRSASGPCLTILLGDYVDRGPQSRAVLDRLAGEVAPTPLIALRGNHEQMLLDALDDPAAFRHWLKYGGLETLASYGLDLSDLRRGGSPEQLRTDFIAALPRDHLAFLRETKTSHEEGDYFFCHAGVRPGVPLHRQSDADLMTIRDAFLTSTDWQSRVVVHGHSPVTQPELLPHRIGLDTGAYTTGRLTCLVLEGDTRRILGT